MYIFVFITNGVNFQFHFCPFIFLPQFLSISFSLFFRSVHFLSNTPSLSLSLLTLISLTNSLFCYTTFSLIFPFHSIFSSLYFSHFFIFYLSCLSLSSQSSFSQFNKFTFSVNSLTLYFLVIFSFLALLLLQFLTQLYLFTPLL